MDKTLMLIDEISDVTDYEAELNIDDQNTLYNEPPGIGISKINFDGNLYNVWLLFGSKPCVWVFKENDKIKIKYCEAEAEDLIDCLEQLLLLCKQMRDKGAVIVQRHLVNYSTN